MAIKGITPRLPRLGMIRLGEKHEKGYPINSQHFVFPQEGEDGYELIKGRFDGEKIDVLRVSFPLNDIDATMADFWRMFTKSGLQCRGDGDIGRYYEYEERKDARGKKYTHKEMKERNCANKGCIYSATDCKPSALISFCLQDAPGLGIWQMSTHSITAIQQFRGVLSLAMTVFGRINNLPFEIYRYPIEVAPDGKKKTVMSVGLRLSPIVSQNLLMAGDPQQFAALPIGKGAGDEGHDQEGDTGPKASSVPTVKPNSSETAAQTAKSGSPDGDRQSQAGAPPAKDPAPPSDALKAADNHLWGICKAAQVKYNLTDDQVKAARGDILEAEFGTGKRSFKNGTPEDLKRIADAIEKDLGILAHAAGVEVDEDDEDIPPFDGTAGAPAIEVEATVVTTSGWADLHFEEGQTVDPATGEILVHPDPKFPRAASADDLAKAQAALDDALTTALPDADVFKRAKAVDSIAIFGLKAPAPGYVLAAGLRYIADRLINETETTIAFTQKNKP